MRDAVRAGYADVAREDFSEKGESLRRIVSAFGYTPGDLASLPDGANLGLSCGNPVAMASLKPGETVVDLGSGGGLDVFLAARAVGPQGRAIGIDMTHEMVALARANAESGGYGNVEFHHAAIESMPLPSASVDCVISNCVLNLVDDKHAALAELFRVLKPGGRLAISDITLKQPLPPELARDVTAWVSCIAGAVSIADYTRALEAAGFANPEVAPTGADLNVYKEASIDSEPAQSCCGGAPAKSDKGFHAALTASLQALDLNNYAAAVRIFAVKP